MNHKTITVIPAAGPDCATFAPLLPLAAQAEHGLLASGEAARLRAHLATCPHCQTVQAGYARVDQALRRLSEHDAVSPTQLTEEIMQSIEERDQPHASTPATPVVLTQTARLHRLLSPAGAVAAVLLISLIAGALFAGRAWLFGQTMLGGHIPAPTQPPRYAPWYEVEAVVAGGANGTWLLGVYVDGLCAQHRYEGALTPPPTGSGPSTGMGTATPDPACASHLLLLRWDGQQWHNVNVNFNPDPSITGLWRVSVLPSGEAFATTGSTMLHLRNGAWSIDPSYAFPQAWLGSDPCHCVNVESLDMLSASDGWAVINSYNPKTTSTIAHYLNGKWTLQSLPASNPAPFFHSISMSSPTEGWAVGFADTQTFTEHYHNGQWTPVVPMVPYNGTFEQAVPGSLNQVQALPNGEAWAVGELDPSAGPGLILHWANGSWSPVVPRGIPVNILHSIDMVSPTEGWVVGDGNEILHLRDGVWTKEGVTVHGLETDQVAMAATTDGWAIGNWLSTPSGADTTQIEHYQNGVWTTLSVATIVAHALNG